MLALYRIPKSISETTIFSESPHHTQIFKKYFPNFDVSEKGAIFFDIPGTQLSRKGMTIIKPQPALQINLTAFDNNREHADFLKDKRVFTLNQILRNRIRWIKGECDRYAHWKNTKIRYGKTFEETLDVNFSEIEDEIYLELKKIAPDCSLKSFHQIIDKALKMRECRDLTELLFINEKTFVAGIDVGNWPAEGSAQAEILSLALYNPNIYVTYTKPVERVTWLHKKCNVKMQETRFAVAAPPPPVESYSASLPLPRKLSIQKLVLFAKDKKEFEKRMLGLKISKNHYKVAYDVLRGRDSLENYQNNLELYIKVRALVDGIPRSSPETFEYKVKNTVITFCVDYFDENQNPVFYALNASAEDIARYSAWMYKESVDKDAKAFVHTAKEKKEIKPKSIDKIFEDCAQ